MASKDNCPLYEARVIVTAGLRDVAILQADALELGGPEGDVRRKRRGRDDTGVEGLHPFELESDGQAARQARLNVAVEAKGVATLESSFGDELSGVNILNDGIEGPSLRIVENLGASGQAAV
jgi:hypothetical protein